MAINCGLYTPTRVPQGVLNTIAFIETTPAEVLTGLTGRTCYIRVDVIMTCAKDAKELMCKLEQCLARLVEQGLFVAAHKAVFFGDEIKQFRRLFSGDATLPDPDRVQGLLELSRPENGSSGCTMLRR